MRQDASHEAAVCFDLKAELPNINNRNIINRKYRSKQTFDLDKVHILNGKVFKKA